MRRLHAPPPPSAWLLSVCVLGAVFLSPLAAHAQTADNARLEQLARDFAWDRMDRIFLDQR